MTELGSLLILGITAFVSTNIDDIFLLIVFFSNSLKFPSSQVVLGQYIGIGLLIAIIPIIIGIKKLIEYHNNKKTGQSNINSTKYKSIQNSSILSVAAVTFSNGGDNIGIYTPLFASNNTNGQIITLITIFMIMTAIWCSIGHYLVRHSFLANNIRSIGHLVLPFVLIGLGVYIILGEYII